MNGLRGQVGCVRNEDADGDFNRAIVNAAFEVVDKPTDCQADRDAARGEPRQRKQATGDGGDALANEYADGEFKGQQSAGVIDEAFTFEDVDDAAAKPDAAGDRCRGDRVGGRDDGAEEEPEPPVEAGKDAGRGPGDSDDGECYQAESEQRDVDDVVTEVAPGGVPGGSIEERRQDDEEDEVGVEGEVGDRGNEAEQQSAEDHDDGVRRSDLAGEYPKDHDEKEKQEKDVFDCPDFAHRAIRTR